MLTEKCILIKKILSKPVKYKIELNMLPLLSVKTDMPPITVVQLLFKGKIVTVEQINMDTK